RLDAESWQGKWVMIAEQSSTVDVFGTVSLQFEAVSADRLALTERWGRSRSREETLDLRLGGAVNRAPIDHKVFPSNVFMGLRREVGADRRIVGRWVEEFRLLE